MCSASLGSALSLLCGALGLACSSAQALCNSVAILEPNFVVTNAVTGETICNATIVPEGLVDAGITQPDQLIEGGAGCEYNSGLLPPGADVAVVSAPGFQTTMVTVVVQQIACFDTLPAPPTVRVALTPD